MERLKNKLTRKYGWLISETGGDKDEIRDIVQELSGKIPERNEAYLFKAAENKIKEVAKRRGWVGSDFEKYPPEPNETKTPDTEMSAEEIKRLCFSVCITEKDKDAMVLILAGYATNKICDIADVKPNRVFSLRKRAQEKVLANGYTRD